MLYLMRRTHFMKKKIAFIATGGTIASIRGGEGIRPAFSEREIIDLVPELIHMADIREKLVMNLDSSNIQPEDWKSIASEVVASLKECDGAVVSHGTDTLAYTAAALTYMLLNLKKPVAVTGAQRSIAEKGSDAKKNLLDSFKVALSGKPGVFVVFNGDIIFGDRATKIKTASFDAFASVNAPLAGQIVEKGIQWNHEAIRNENERIERIRALHISCNPKDTSHTNSGIQPETADENKGAPAELYDNLDPRVLLIKLYPGIEPDLLLFAKKKGYHSVLIESFGAGGVPFCEPHNLIPTVQELVSSGIKVAVTTQVPFEGVNLSLYETGLKVWKAGAFSMGDDTREAALVRLMLNLA